MYTYYSNFLYFWMGGFSCWHVFCSISVCVVMDSGSYPCHSQSPIPHTRSIAKPFISTCQGLQYNLCSEKLILLFYFLKGFIYLYLETREGKEKERERNINVWLPLAHPLLGTWPATQACALPENWTSDPLLRRLVLNPLSYSSQGTISFLKKKINHYPHIGLLLII